MIFFKEQVMPAFLSVVAEERCTVIRIIYDR